MAQAKVFPPTIDVFSPPRIVAGGWGEDFPVIFLGADVAAIDSRGFMADSVSVDFLDADSGLAMDHKINLAVIAKGAARGVVVASTGVIGVGASSRRLV